jgi:8-hydroxy-5-deazaflavin:NADPH oxidoreductase
VTTAIIGVGSIGTALARHLVAGDEPVVLAAKDESHAEALAQRLAPLARANSVDYAIATADVVVFAVWLDTIKELIAKYASLLENKVVVDPTNPLEFHENGQIIRTLPEGQSAGSIVASLLPARTAGPVSPRTATERSSEARRSSGATARRRCSSGAGCPAFA